MKAIIIRDMTVMGDNGTIRHFAKSTLEKPFEEISQAIYGRLVRAGAASPYLPPSPDLTPKPNPPSPEPTPKTNPPKRKRGRK